MVDADIWQGVFHRKEFWTDYFWITEDDDVYYQEVRNHPIEFRISNEYALSLSIDPHLWEDTLYLIHPGSGEPVQLAWDDQAHFHPNALRWNELEAVCRCVAKREPEMEHPAIPLLLLFRFAPITGADDKTAIRNTLVSACRSLRIFTDDEVASLLDEVFLLSEEVLGIRRDWHWVRAPDLGWTLEGEDEWSLYSLRRAINNSFPFGPLEAAFEQARRCTAGS